jgi:Flp pilus assembly protein TadG
MSSQTLRNKQSENNKLGNKNIGQASVEFAILMPFLLVFMLLLVQLGVFVRDVLYVQQISRDVARESSFAVPTDEFKQEIESKDLSIKIEVEEYKKDYIKVTTTKNTKFLFSIFKVLVPDQVSNSNVMRKE